MGCSNCFLYEEAQNTCIPYDGPSLLDGGILFVGEAPGKEEDRQGRVFVGPTGRLLRAFVRSLDLKVPVGYTNSVKCYPGKNNVVEYVETCRKLLVKDVVQRNPARVITLGATALKAILGTSMGNNRMLDMVGGWAHVRPYSEISLGKWSGIVQFAIHPSFCLHNPSMKQFWLSTTREVITNVPNAKRLFPPSDVQILDVTSIEETNELVDELIQIGKSIQKPLVVALDTEYTGSNNRLMCLAISYDPQSAHVFDEEVCQLISRPMIRLFRSPHIQMSAHNWKFDAHAMSDFWDIPDSVFVDAINPWYDTSSFRKIDNPEQDSNLAVTSWRVGMGGHKNEMLALMGRVRTEQAYEKAYDQDPEVVLRYCGYDAVAALRAAHFYRNLLIKEGLWQVWVDTMGPLGPSLFLLEQEGVSIDAEAMEALDQRLEAQLSIMLKAIRGSVAVRRLVANGLIDEFNPRSTDHKKLLLFHEKGLGLKSVKKTAKGGDSVDADVLSRVAKKYKVLSDLSEYNAVAHRRSTYVQGYRKVIHADGKIHPTYRQDIARTGRLSCQNPNVQNIETGGVL